MIWTLLILPLPSGGDAIGVFPATWKTRGECVAASQVFHKASPADTMCVGRKGRILNAQVTQLNPTEDDSTDVKHDGKDGS